MQARKNQKLSKTFVCFYKRHTIRIKTLEIYNTDELHNIHQRFLEKKNCIQFLNTYTLFFHECLLMKN
jgi:hypothetical protein